MIKVKLADGRVINVQEDDPQKAAQTAHRWGKDNPKKPAAPARPAETTWRDRASGLAGNFLDGILPGTSGFVRGVRETAINAAQAPFSDEVDFDPIAAYNRGKSQQEVTNKRAQAADPRLNSGAQVAGLVGSFALPASKIASGASLGTKAAKGAKDAAIYSGVSGPCRRTRTPLPADGRTRFPPV